MRVWNVGGGFAEDASPPCVVLKPEKHSVFDSELNHDGADRPSTRTPAHARPSPYTRTTVVSNALSIDRSPHPSVVQAFIFTVDMDVERSLIVSGGLDENIHIWNYKEAKRRAVIPEVHRCATSALPCVLCVVRSVCSPPSPQVWCFLDADPPEHGGVLWRPRLAPEGVRPRDAESHPPVRRTLRLAHCYAHC